MSRALYEPHARAMAAKYGIDPDIFVRQITQESGWNPRAGSPAGAQGIAQIIPRWHPGVDVWDPYASLDYAARLMASHLKNYGGDYALALAAYNAGPGAVAEYRGVPPFEETQHYIRTILGGSKTVAKTPAVATQPPLGGTLTEHTDANGYRWVKGGRDGDYWWRPGSASEPNGAVWVPPKQAPKSDAVTAGIELAYNNAVTGKFEDQTVQWDSKTGMPYRIATDDLTGQPAPVEARPLDASATSGAALERVLGKKLGKGINPTPYSFPTPGGTYVSPTESSFAAERDGYFRLTSPPPLAWQVNPKFAFAPSPAQYDGLNQTPLAHPPSNYTSPNVEDRRFHSDNIAIVPGTKIRVEPTPMPTPAPERLPQIIGGQYVGGRR